MEISDFKGTKTVNLPDELEKCLSIRYEIGEAREILLAYFMEPATQLCWSSSQMIAQASGICRTRMILDFGQSARYAGSNGNDTALFYNDGQPQPLPMDSVVAVPDAVLAAKEFLNTKSIPKSAKWFEL